jgi:prephenate dehydrogenase
VSAVHVKRLALIGCGLMGGSFALALREKGLVDHISGYSASAATRAKALSLGIIDTACDSVAQAVEGADVVLLAVPVAATPDCLSAMRDALSDDALVMDVGSTKSDVVEAATQALGDRLPCFVPAHPIAGKEVAGIEHAETNLYQDRWLILTPTEATRGDLTQRAQTLWQALGSRVMQLTPQAHDAAFAAVSHLPHLMAFALVQSIAEQAQGDLYLSIAGPGFKDFSRIAASDPKVWRDILLANREQVLLQSQHMRASLDKLEAAMRADDATTLEKLITSASHTRSAWQASNG